MLSKFVNCIKLERLIGSFMVRDALQRNLNRLEELNCHHVKLNKGKYQIPYLGWSNVVCILHSGSKGWSASLQKEKFWLMVRSF